MLCIEKGNKRMHQADLWCSVYSFGWSFVLDFQILPVAIFYFILFAFMPTCCTFVFHQLEKLDKPPCFLCSRLMYPCWQSQNRPPVPWCVNLVLKGKKAPGGHRIHGNSRCLSRMIFFMPVERQMCTGMCKCESAGKNVNSLSCCLPSFDLTDYSKTTDAHQATFTNTCAETQHETTFWQTYGMLLWKTGPYQVPWIGL